MRPTRLIPLAVLLPAALAAFPSAAGATWPGKPGRIAYSALSDNGDGIYSIRPNGTGNRRILPGADGDMAWSRDGKRIAYFRTNEELWVARSDGSHRHLIRRFTGGDYAADVAWSPSGRRIVFTGSTEEEVGEDEDVITTDTIYVIHRDGKGMRKLRRGHDPTWSSGNLIAYATGGGKVVTIRPNGRGRHIWVPQGSPVYVSNLDFSPNGRRLVYEQGIEKSSIRTINLRTGRRTRFRSGTKQVNATDIAWAPNNSRIAYMHSPRGKTGEVAPADEIRTIRPNGKRRRTVVTLPREPTVFDFAWQTR